MIQLCCDPLLVLGLCLGASTSFAAVSASNVFDLTLDSRSTGRIAGADQFKVRFKLPDGTTQLLDGAPKRYFHQIHSLTWLPGPTLHAAATSGVYGIPAPTPP